MFLNSLLINSRTLAKLFMLLTKLKSYNWDKPKAWGSHMCELVVDFAASNLHDMRV